MGRTIDLNADLGEHPNSDLDALIMPHLSSCNIACGGHIGDEASVIRTVKLATQYSVRIGAHPSYPDRENFGRRTLEMDPIDLRSSLRKQIGLVVDVAEKLGEELHHVKPHGALYNDAAQNRDTAHLLCEVVHEVDPQLKLYGLAHSILQEVAVAHNIQFVAEAFVDRQYLSDKTLMPRSNDAAVLADQEKVMAQAQELAINKRVRAEGWVDISAQTLCLHSDTEGAVNLAAKVKSHLERLGVHITAIQ